MLLRGARPPAIERSPGALRYALPDTTAGMPESRAQTYVYGYYLVTVAPDGSLNVDFREVKRPDIPTDVEQRYGAAFVDKCFADNRDTRVMKSANCTQNKPCAMP